MVSKQIRDQYTVTIGIQCHVQLKTATKLFAAVGNDAREADPNTLVSPLCFGLPGTLPVLNKEAVHLAMRAAFALGTEPQAFTGEKISLDFQDADINDIGELAPCPRDRPRTHAVGAKETTTARTQAGRTVCYQHSTGAFD